MRYTSDDKRIRSKDLYLKDLEDLRKRGGGGRVWRLEREERERKRWWNVLGGAFCAEMHAYSPTRSIGADEVSTVY